MTETKRYPLPTKEGSGGEPRVLGTATIDFIAFSPSGKFTVKKHSVIPERYASDHLPVFATLEIYY